MSASTSTTTTLYDSDSDTPAHGFRNWKAFCYVLFVVWTIVALVYHESLPLALLFAAPMSIANTGSFMMFAWFLVLLYRTLTIGWGGMHGGLLGGLYMAWTITARLGRWGLFLSVLGYLLLIPFATLSTPLVGR